MIDDMPIIELNVHHMANSLKLACISHLESRSKYVQEMIDKVCSPENIRAVVEKEAKSVFEELIRDALKNYYRYGEGKKFVVKKVEEYLKTKFD